jgi:hypothetical protein
MVIFAYFCIFCYFFRHFYQFFLKKCKIFVNFAEFRPLNAVCENFSRAVGPSLDETARISARKPHMQFFSLESEALYGRPISRNRACPIGKAICSDFPLKLNRCASRAKPIGFSIWSQFLLKAKDIFAKTLSL